LAVEDVETYILNLAKRRFERFGYPKTTIDELARDGRISKKTIYRHFRSKEQLFIRVATREALTAREEVLQRLGEVEDPLARLKKLVVTALDYFQEQRFILKLLADEDGIFLPYSQSKYAVMAEKEMVSVIADVLREGMRKGNIRKLDERIVGYIMLKLIQVLTFARTDALPRINENSQHERAELLEFLERAIGTDA
jgi:AcrR family transcriptional regulator